MALNHSLDKALATVAVQTSPPPPICPFGLFSRSAKSEDLPQVADNSLTSSEVGYTPY